MKILSTHLLLYNSDGDSGDKLGVKLVAAYKSTAKKYRDVYSSKLESVVSMLLHNGSQLILNGDNNNARCYAFLARYFEEYLAVDVHKTKPTTNWSKISELDSTDDHTLVKYFRKRIPCSCLDEKYTRTSNMLRRWDGATMLVVVGLIRRWSAARCSIVVDVVVPIIVPLNVKRPTGKHTGSSVTK